MSLRIRSARSSSKAAGFACLIQTPCATQVGVRFQTLASVGVFTSACSFGMTGIVKQRMAADCNCSADTVTVTKLPASA